MVEKPVKLSFVAKIHGGEFPRKVKVSGRPAWLLARLLAAGAKGITTLETPAPRVSHYLFMLRRAGFNISTEDEQHGGPFGGRHGRFKLVDMVTIEPNSGTLDQYMSSPEGRREFPNASFARQSA